jgi:hypothetical protein
MADLYREKVTQLARGPGTRRESSREGVRQVLALFVGASFERMDDGVLAYIGGGRIATRFSRWYLGQIYGPPFDYHIANSDYTADELRQVLWDRPADFIRVRPISPW